jgi:hypothetical protein
MSVHARPTVALSLLLRLLRSRQWGSQSIHPAAANVRRITGNRMLLSNCSADAEVQTLPLARTYQLSCDAQILTIQEMR